MNLKADFKTNSGLQWVWRFIFVSFALPRQGQVWSLLALALYVLIRYKSHLWTLKIQKFIPVVFFALPFLIYLPLYFLVPDQDVHLVHEFVERKSALLVLPLFLILFIQKGNLPNEPLWLWFVAAIIARGFFGNVVILFNYHAFLSTWNHVSYRQAMEQAIQMHPTTFGIYVGMAATFLLEYGFHTQYKKWHWILYGILMSMLILLFPKTPVLAVVLIHILYLFRFRKRIITKQAIFPLFITVAGLSLIVNLHVVKDRIFELFQANQNVSSPNSVQVRQLIWQTDIALLKNHWLKGMGPGELQRNLDLSMLYQSSLSGQSLGSYNTHNEYLNYWLVFGIPGILALLILIGYFVYKACQLNTLSAHAFVILVTLVFFTENWLSVQHGVVFVAVFGVLLFSAPTLLNSGKEH